MLKSIGIAGFGGAVGVPVWGIALAVIAIAGTSVAIGYALGNAAGACVAATVAAA